MLAAAVRLYRRGLNGQGTLNAVTAHFIRDDLKGVRRHERGAIAKLAHTMWRHRALLDFLEEQASTKQLGRDAVGLYGLVLTDRELQRAFDVVLPRAVIDVVITATKTAPLAVRASLPEWLCARLLEIGGETLALSFTKAPPTTLRANTLKATRDDVIRALYDEGVRTKKTERSKTGLVVDNADVFRTRAFHDGLFEVQDEGSQLIAALCLAKPGEKVVDGCAGAGGKTLALAAAMENKGQIVALDVHDGRLKALQERARRAGAHNIRAVSLEEAPKLVKRLKDACDLVLVDAPCTGTGVLRRNPDTSWRLHPDDVARLVALQRTLLVRYAPLVKAGGRLVYATCSLLPEENDEQVAAFLADHADFVVEERLSLRPDRDKTDGFFAVRFRRGIVAAL